MSRASVIDFDIETYRTRNERVIEALRVECAEKRPAGNKSKEEKALWDTEASREARFGEALGDTAKDVLLAEVLCCAFAVEWAGGAAGATGVDVVDGVDEVDGHAKTADGDIRPPVRGGAAHEVMVIWEWSRSEDIGEVLGERGGLSCLARVWDELAGADTVWAGHNVIGYDLAVLLNRWRRYGIRPPEHFPKYVNGRWIGRVYDTMYRTPCKNGMGFVSQDRVMDALGIPNVGYAWGGAPMTGARVGAAYEAGEYGVIEEYCATDVRAQRALRRVMTCGGTWGTYDARSAVAEQVMALERDGSLSGEARCMAQMNVLRMNGMVPGI